MAAPEVEAVNVMPAPEAEAVTGMEVAELMALARAVAMVLVVLEEP